MSDTNATTAVELIEEQAEARIRREWHDGRWFFSVIDVIGLLQQNSERGDWQAVNWSCPAQL